MGNTRDLINLNTMDISSAEFGCSGNLVTVLETKDFGAICRTCLCENHLNPIFETCLENELLISDLLANIIQLQDLFNEKLPRGICADCMETLYRIYIFKNKCLQIEIALRNALKAKEEQETKKREFKEETKNNSIKEDATEKTDMVFYNDNEDSINSEEDKLSKIKSKQKTKKSCPRSNLQYKCRICCEIFVSSEELKIHRQETKHVEKRNRLCPICNKTFTSSKLKEHMRVHTKEMPYVCDICNRAFSMSGNLKRHKMTHTGERPHVCQICGKGFIQATSLQIHARTHSNHAAVNGARNFNCNLCGRYFKRVFRFKQHLEKHSLEGKYNEIKVRKLRGGLVLGDYVCEICNKRYKTKHLLKAHALTHGEKRFLCSDCGKGFVTKAALQSHLKVHTGEKPYTCTICKKSFAHVGSFDSHMLTHTGQKPYNCQFCSKAFTQLSHLKYHLRIHSGERPYSCSYCGKTFALKGNLTVHVRTHTGETPHLCNVCGKGFYDSSSMKKHRRSHTITEYPLLIDNQMEAKLEDSLPDNIPLTEQIGDFS